MSECVIGERIGANGYARIPSGKRGTYLSGHRVAWEAVHGPIEPGFHLHHACGVKACVNVEHLELLTPPEHYARHRSCEHDERYVRPDGRSGCRVCAREKARVRERVRYASDPEFRAKKISRSVAYKRRKREEVMR